MGTLLCLRLRSNARAGIPSPRVSAASIGASPHCGHCLFRLISPPMKFPPKAVIGGSSPNGFSSRPERPTPCAYAWSWVSGGNPRIARPQSRFARRYEAPGRKNCKAGKFSPVVCAPYENFLVGAFRPFRGFRPAFTENQLPKGIRHWMVFRALRPRCGFWSRGVLLDNPPLMPFLRWFSGGG